MRGVAARIAVPARDRVLLTTTEQAAVIFPPRINGRGIIAPLNNPVWSQPGPSGTVYRRGVTRGSPTRFALTYLSHYLRQQETGILSFSIFHLGMARSAISWIPDRGGLPHPRRDAWIAPRGASKSVWQFLVLPLWALAHGHRRFFLSFAASAGQASAHLANIRAEIDPAHGNQLLLRDFPDLAISPRRGSRNTHQTVTMSGATLAARGMGETTLGLRVGTDRPDLIIGDDLESGEADYSPAKRDKQLSRFVNNVLPMGTRSTVVQIAGTVTMYGSIMHDCVQHALGRKSAPWIVENGFQTHYYPPIIIDPDGTRRSLWPQRWTLAELEAMEGTRSYELNYLNDPAPGRTSASAYWTAEKIRYRPPFVPTRRVVSIDTAVTKKATSDWTALVVVGSDATGRRASVEHAFAGKVSGSQIREMIWQWVERCPQTLKDVIYESNQGGDMIEELFRPLPFGVRLTGYHQTKNKRVRTMIALDSYESLAVWHHRPLPVLEEQMTAWPNVSNDDLIDAMSAGIQWALKDHHG